MEIQVLNQDGKEVGKADLPDGLFGAKPQPSLLHEVVTAVLANRRSGTAQAKTRSEVSGGGKKPWKQKHTGRARQGSIRSPLWRKGGVVFGPRLRSYRQELPRAKHRLALVQALSARQAGGAIRIVESLAVEKPKTAAVAKMLEAWKASGQTILVLDRIEPGLRLAARNIPSLSLRLAADLNAYEVLKAGSLVFTRESLAGLTARLSRGEN